MSFRQIDTQPIKKGGQRNWRISGQILYAQKPGLIRILKLKISEICILQQPIIT